MNPTYILLLKGAFVTLQIMGISLSLGLFFGSVLGILNCKKWRDPFLGRVIDAFVSLIRGTPLFVQLLIAYFAIPEILHINLSPFIAGVITLGLNSSAYISEIIRAGIDSIDEGQWEAGFTLGYSKTMSMRYLILPQVFSTVGPAITNEMTSLVKESSILMMIGVPELTKVGRDIVARELNPMSMYLLVAMIYFTITKGLSYCMKKMEVSHDSW